MSITTVIEDLSEEELCLWDIISDESGLDLAEFCFTDEENPDGIWRAWPFQWSWFRCTDPQQIDQSARSVGKSLSIRLRAFVFPFIHPGGEMVITAPELNHLEPITDLIETQFYGSRLGRYMLQGGRSGVTHRPFKMNFKNGARIFGRIPQKDGKGIKGIHPVWLEMDESQDYPTPGWIEIFATLKRGSEGHVWRAHGVTKGVRDKFWEYTQPGSGWVVHRWCLPGETLVYGVHGPVPISEIEPGTEIWTITEDGQLSKDVVTRRLDNGIQPTWRVRAKGGLDLVSTGNHPYLVLSRGGTRRTRRSLQFEWVEAQELQPGDYILGVRSLPASGDKIPTPEEVSLTLNSKSPVRVVPDWVWHSTPAMQLAFLHGYLMGDGSLARQKRGQDPWQIGTASPLMARQLRALCHYLGLRVTAIDEIEVEKFKFGNGPQYRFCVYGGQSWFWQIPGSYSQVTDGEELEGLGENFIARRVKSVELTGNKVETFDITVGEGHNFIAEGVVVHNTAMHRPPPHWSDDEREANINLYHSREDPDYKRNILGEHGDATSPIFVLHRLMACVDDDLESSYNTDEYCHFEITDEWLRSAETTIDQELDLPGYHLDKYKRFWVGQDVGWTNHPSEIVVFAEEKMQADEYNYYKKTKVMERHKAVPPLISIPRLKLVCRITLSRIGGPDQKRAIMKVINHYQPQAFSFDATGAGLPMFQDIQEEVANLDYVKTVIKGYNFSGNILVDFDQSIEVSEYATKEEEIQETGIKRNTVQYATDKLRYLVDNGRFWLPWEKDLLAEFEGQTYKVTKTALDAYGKREYSLGKFHALDACRMMALGWAQYAIEEFVKRDDQEPILDLFFS